jgi:23S rRNA (guanine745-N1)-methyltransferase
MNKKINSAKIVEEFESLFMCPHCGNSMKVDQYKSLVCINNHTFDFAKQGYLNLTRQSSKSPYKKELFETRHKIITESNLYENMQESITTIINQYTENSIMLADMGCGEGSHLQKIANAIPTIASVGIDLSKEAIVTAAKRYEKPIWLVGDLANLPLMDQSFHVILNILSPSNYKEFMRILDPNGLIIKVVPSQHYLKELREAIFENTNKTYKNDEIVSLFNRHFKLLDMIHVRYTKKLNQAELHNLVQMTPLTWSSEKDRIDTFLSQKSAEITVDLDILVGKNREGNC